jgi:hypothetical protein
MNTNTNPHTLAAADKSTMYIIVTGCGTFKVYRTPRAEHNVFVDKYGYTMTVPYSALYSVTVAE